MCSTTDGLSTSLRCGLPVSALYQDLNCQAARRCKRKSLGSLGVRAKAIGCPVLSHHPGKRYMGAPHCGYPDNCAMTVGSEPRLTATGSG